MSPQVTRRCAIYVRKSTTHGLEKDFNSLDAQREACAGYIRGQPGWRLLPTTYEDGGFSGATTDRPGFQRLLSDVEAGAIDVVVVYKVDRLSRSLLDFAKVMDRFGAKSVAFVSVTQNFSTADAIGRLTLNMMMSFAEFEREMIAERTRDKIHAARRKGKWTGGSPVLGYDVVDGGLLINDVEAEQVRTIYALYLELGSPLEVIGELEARGITLKRYVSRKTGRVREPPPWDADSLVRLLRNPVYAGLIPCAGQVYPGEHQAIVPRETWEEARVLLSNPRKRIKPSHGYLLKGLLRCGGCGAPMSPASTRKKGAVYRYYRCLTRAKQGRHSCTTRSLPADEIDLFVAARVSEAASGPALAQEVRDRAEARRAQERAALNGECQRLAAAIGRASQELSAQLERARGLQGAARMVVEESAQATSAQITQSEQRLGEVKQRLAGIRSQELEAGWVARALGDFQGAWSAMNDDNRNRLLLALLEKVVVNESSGEVAVTLADLGPGDQSSAA